MSDKQYGHDDARDYEPYFSRHLMAMTAEDLHSKGEIACELAYRDQRIAELEAEEQRLQPLADDNEAHFVELKAVAEAALKHTRRYSVDDLDTYAALIDALHAAGYIYAGTVPKPSRDSGSTNE